MVTYSNWKIYIILSAIVYVAMIGTLILVNDFLPYVLDNNESFSSLLHARNIFEFGFRGSWGLTDESLGSSIESGPALYTHNGNFPRFFALAIYALGARSVESQILVTSMTIGLGGYLYGLYVVKRLSSPIFAMIFGLLMLTDYVMAVQWQVVTWQVWRFVFLFSSIHVVMAISEKPTKLRFLIGVLNFFCLFYYDVVFAFFIITISCLYGLWSYPRRRAAIAILTMAGGGVFLGGLILVGQSILALGWEVFLTDLKYTYLSRNIFTDPSLTQTYVNFFRKYNIVNFFNFSDGTALFNPLNVVRVFFSRILSVYTPNLSILVLIIGGAAMITAISPKWSLGRILDRCAPVAFFIAVNSCAIAILYAVESPLGIWPVLLGGGVFLFLPGVEMLRSLASSRTDPSAAIRRWVGALWFFGIAYVIFRQGWLFNPELQSFYDEIEVYTGSKYFSAVTSLLALWLAARIILEDSDKDDLAIRSVVKLMVCGAGAFLVTVIIFPGYVNSVVFNRAAPLTVGVHLMFFSLAFYAILRRTNFSVNLLNLSGNIGWWTLPRRHFIGTSVVLVFAVASWIVTQGIYSLRLSGNSAEVYKILKRPEFQGASFAVNTYATPAGISTGQWAYFDGSLHEFSVNLTDEGFDIRRDARYLWFKDWETNPEYRYPDYYLCFYQRSILDVLPGGNPSAARCGGLGPSYFARSGGNVFLAPTEVFRDESSADRWAIVRLNWSRVPYPKRLQDGYLASAKIRRREKNTAIEPFFRLAENSLKPTQVLFTIHSIGSCAGQSLGPILSTTDAESLILPKDTEGDFQLEVRLSSATSPLAVRLFSEPFTLRNASEPRRCDSLKPFPKFTFLNEGKQTSDPAVSSMDAPLIASGF